MKKRRILILSLLMVLLVSFLFLHRGTSSRRPLNHDNSIARIHSSVDQDGDGIDDQTDILQNALAYVNTHPEYKSAYYAGGYPDDGCGVCTDVIAFALKNAGYDLRELVDQDIAADPQEYDVSQPDKNIDFRRVKNLQVYFSHHSVSLSTDISEIEEWQGGDIVVFNNHIGIVSDRRNKDGVPYVIHHSSPYQTKYEQDILENRDDIIGHYRISI